MFQDRSPQAIDAPTEGGKGMPFYRYLRMHKRYVCLDSVTLVPLLKDQMRMGRALGLGNVARLFLHRMRIAHRYAANQIICLPVYGQYSISVQQGYLVFNLEREVVAQVFRPRVSDAAFRARVDTLTEVSRLTFAPLLGQVNPTDQWHEMAYIEGEPGVALVADSPEGVADTFERLVCPCLRELAAFKDWQWVSALDYVHTLCNSMHFDVLRDYPRVDVVVREHVAELRDAISRRAPRKMALAFSHGDFVHPNFIGTPQGLRVVDWDTADWRSALHDLHTYYFSQMYWNSTFVVSIDQIHAAVTSVHPEDPGGLVADIDIYRELYYMERIAMVLGRAFSRADADHLIDAVWLHKEFERTSARASVPTGA